MTFGQTFEEVAKNKTFPKILETPFGYTSQLIRVPEFSLKKFSLNENYMGKIAFGNGFLFLEQGALNFPGNLIVNKGEVLQIADKPYKIEVVYHTIAYLFSNSFLGEDLTPKKTFDVREKYWGKIESIVSNNYLTGKRISMRAGSPGSLEYHLNKKEAYYLQSGKLRVGLRVGRAENKSVTMSPGEVFCINSGIMHGRYPIEDSIIIEISTKDDDFDSHLVEDGSKGYSHPEIHS